MKSELRREMSYLLRLWQTKSRGELVWQANLVSPQTGERQGFVDLDGLFEFLRRETGAPQDEEDECAPE